MKTTRILCQKASSSFMRITERAVKIKRTMRYELIVLGLIVSGLAALAASTGQAEYSRSELRPDIVKVLDMDADSMIRAIRSMKRENLMGLIRGVDPYVLARVLRAMDPYRIARLIQVATEDPSLIGLGSPSRRISLKKIVETRGAGASSGSQESSGKVVNDITLAVIIHPSNPIAQLSESELLQICSGRVSNWRQVGGPDLPVELMGSGVAPTGGFLKGPPDFHLGTCPFSSVIMAEVAANKAALGLIPANRLQKAFLSSHSAIKKIAITR